MQRLRLLYPYLEKRLPPGSGISVFGKRHFRFLQYYLMLAVASAEKLEYDATIIGNAAAKNRNKAAFIQVWFYPTCRRELGY